jgi:hypothetical protein
MSVSAEFLSQVLKYFNPSETIVQFNKKTIVITPTATDLFQLSPKQVIELNELGLVLDLDQECWVGNVK